MKRYKPIIFLFDLSPTTLVKSIWIRKCIFLYFDNITHWFAKYLQCNLYLINNYISLKILSANVILAGYKVSIWSTWSIDFVIISSHPVLFSTIDIFEKYFYPYLIFHICDYMSQNFLYRNTGGQVSY